MAETPTSMTTLQRSGQWDKAQLEGKGTDAQVNSTKKRFAGLKRTKSKGPGTIHEWGFPGELTDEQVECFKKFRDEVEKRGGDFHEAVYSFGDVEGEAFTLTRWLRARKYKYDDVVKMVEEAVECRSEAKKDNFYPDPYEALGCDPSVYLTLFPQLYTGKAKTGCPLFISKPGQLQPDALDCMTTIEGLLKFHWHIMVHDFSSKLHAYKAENPNFCRFECFCILDLAHLSSTQLSSRCLDIVKKQSFIDSLCFPETMNKMIIVNAPKFFTLTWKVIKGWIDARTAAKVELYSSKSSSSKRLLELVDKNELPSDYGGAAKDSNELIAEQNANTDVKRVETHLMHMRKNASWSFTVESDEDVMVSAYTNSSSGAIFSVVNTDKQTIMVKSPDGKPALVDIIPKGKLSAGTYKLRGDSNSGMLHSDNFVIVVRAYAK